MSIATEITRLQTAKANIKTAIENKGVTVPSNATLSNYNTYISQISNGGGGQSNNGVITTIDAGDVAGASGVFNPSFSSLLKPLIISAVIPSGYTSIVQSAFSGCTNLTSAIIPNSVTSIGADTFNNCSSLTSVTIGTGTTTLPSDFCVGCTSITSVGTTGIGANIEIPNNITSIGQQAFSGCTNLTSVTMPNSVVSIGTYCFLDCSSLTSLTFSNTLTTIGVSSLRNCSSLTSVTIPNSVTTIGDSAFNGCSSLISVTVEATTPPTIQRQYSGVFDNNASGRKIYVPSASVEAYKSATGWSDYASDIEAIPNE